MPGSTPVRDIPYPSPTDPINAYPALAQSAAQNLDTHAHDRSTVTSAQYADQAGNADTIDGQHAAAFAPASHGLHPGGGTTVVTTDGNGAFVLSGWPICQNGDYTAYGELLIFHSSPGGTTRAKLLWGNESGGLVVIGTGQPAAGVTIRVNWITL